MRHYPMAAGWEEKALVNWVSWAIKEGFLFMTGHEREIAGLAIVRPTMTPHKMPNNLEFDQEGDTYYVDLAIALSPRRDVLQALCFSVLKRFGMRDKIAFQRQGVGPVLVIDAHAHRRKLLRQMRKV